MNEDSARQLNLLCKDVTETDLAYIAGLFDGEGSISTVFSNNKKNHLYLTICITNTDREILEWIKDILGGSIGIHHRPRGYRTCYRWVINHRLAIGRIMNALYPYLRIKKKQTELLLKLLNTFQSQPGSGVIGGKQTKLSFSEEYWNEIKHIVEDIRKLNMRKLARLKTVR